MTPTAARAVLLRGGRVLVEDGTRFIARDVLVQNGQITAVAPALAAPEDADVWDLQGDLVLPGLVNAHYHSPDALNSGLVRPDAPLELWSLRSVPARDQSAEDLALAVRLSAAQHLLGGVTGVVDMVRPSPALTLEKLEAVAEAYASSGLRAAVAPVVADLPLARTLPIDASLGPSLDDPAAAAASLQVVRAFFARRDGSASGRLRVQVAPSGPQRCSDALLEGSVALARDLQTRLHTHAVETRLQAEQARRRWGQSLLGHLDALGGLGPDIVLAHVVWPERSDVALLAERGAVVVHNPASNCALGSGLAPLPSLLRAGVRLALGTDASTCNDGLSMFESMKLATILHRPLEADWTVWPTPAAALAMATHGGAAALGQAGSLGRVAPGHRADLVVLEATAPAFVPAYDLVHQVVMRAGPGAVRDVLVEGVALVRDRVLQTLDWRSIVREVERFVERRAASLGDAAPTDAVLEAAIEQVLRESRPRLPVQAA